MHEIVYVPHGVVDSNMYPDSSSSGRSSSMSEDNTGTSRSPTAAETEHCPGLQIPQTPILIKKQKQKNTDNTLVNSKYTTTAHL